MPFDHMNQIDADGTAFDGRRGPVLIALLTIAGIGMAGLAYLFGLVAG